MVTPSSRDDNMKKARTTPLTVLWSWIRARVSSFLFTTSGSSVGGSNYRKDWTKKGMILIGILAVVALSMAYAIHRTVSWKLNSKDWAEAPVNYIQRDCEKPAYQTVTQYQATEKGKADPKGSKPSICITTLTDEKQADWTQKAFKWRQFKNLLDLTWSNKEAYCDKHGYHLIDSSPYLDNSRPPSWSKIVAARRLLKGEGYDGYGQPLQCDWVVWLDADTVVMNSDKKIEDVLPAPDATQDFVVTRQKGRSYNAGAWMVRNTEWGLGFLDTWWGLHRFVRAKGLSVSGDNDALYYLLRSDGDGTTIGSQPEVFKEHIVVPPRCNFNSVTKWVSPEMAKEYERHPEKVKEESWYMDEEIYHLGDLIAHVAGRNNKIDTTKMLLEHVK